MQATNAMSTFASRSLRRYSGGAQPQVHLVCFPWCGAGASVFRRLALSLPEHIALLAVQLPGREERFLEDRLLSMEQVVEHVIEEIVQLRERPLVLFGHSMGALVAYEVAVALRNRTGREPDMLIVSGHGSPGSREYFNRSWHKAGDEEFIANIRQLGGTPSSILEDRDMMQALMPVMRADYEVLDTYVQRAASPLTCPLIACAGEDDKEVTHESMSAWQQYAAGPYRNHWFSGDHFYLNSRPRALTRRMEEWIAQEALAAR